jgi:hypothetical protein
MATVHIDPRRVMGVIVEANRALNGQGFNQPEVLLGLSQLIGRVIVEMSPGPSDTEAYKELCKNHIDDTVRLGFEAKGIIHSSGG